MMDYALAQFLMRSSFLVGLWLAATLALLVTALVQGIQIRFLQTAQEDLEHRLDILEKEVEAPWKKPQ